jgi:hypothetical protein
MYQVDDLDKVVELHTLPQSSIGAPLPITLSDEFTTVIAYLIEEDKEYNTVAVVTFKSCYSMMFGPPNDEAFNGHPLYSRGLKPYSFFQIEHSSWIRRLEKMNSVHPSHSHSMFEDYKHYVLSFHDSTFECIAEGYGYIITKTPDHDMFRLIRGNFQKRIVL